MRVTRIAYEALTSLRASAARNLTIIAAISSLITGVAMLEGLNAHSLLSDYRQSLRDGADVVAVSRESGASMSSRVCMDVSAISVVRRSGGLSESGVVHSANAPGLAFQSAQVTGAAFEILAGTDSLPSSNTASAMITSGVARDLGLVDGSELLLDSGERRTVVGVGDVSARAAAQARWIFLSGGRTISQCWIEFNPGGRTAGVDAVRAFFSAHYADAQVAAIRAHGSESVLASWSTRPSRFGWVGGALAGVLAVFLVWIPRRREFALRVALGQRRATVLLQVELEGFMLAGVLVITSCGFAALVLRGVASDSEWLALYYAIRQAALSGVTLAVCLPLLAGAMMTGEVHDLLRR